MQSIQEGGTVRIELVPGAVLFARVVGTGSVATISLDSAEGAVSFSTASTVPNGVAEAGPFKVTAILSVHVAGRASVSVVPFGAVSFLGRTLSDLQAQAIAGELPVGGLYVLSDGPDKGARLTYAVPEGGAAPTLCWWLWPASAYEPS